MKQAILYEKLGNNLVKCEVCSHNCIIAPDKKGLCGVRENKNGELFSLVYGKAIAINLDPIEKKPFFHFLPGTYSLSVATMGCNFSCLHCFTPSTIIITERGVDTIASIFESGVNGKLKTGNTLLKDIPNHKTITHSGKLSKVLRASEHYYNGNLIKIKPFYSPAIKCTPEHKLFVSTNPISGKIQKIKARKLTNQHYLVMPKKYNFPSSNIIIDLKEILKDRISIFKKRTKITPKIIEKIMTMLENGYTSRQIGQTFNFHPTYIRHLHAKLRKLGKNDLSTLFFGQNVLMENGDFIKFKEERKPFIPRFIKLDKKFARLLGYYCAEGCVRKNKNRPNTFNVTFTFGAHEKKQIKEVEKVLYEIFRVRPYIENRRTGVAIVLTKASAALLFKTLCGDGARNKKVPDIINSASKEIVHAFLSAYVDGDGCILTDVISINTVSKNLALGIYWLWLKMGFLPRYYEWQPISQKKIEERVVNQSTLYYVKLGTEKFKKQFLSPNKKIKVSEKSKQNIRFVENKSYYFIPIFEISREEYSGPVYNLEIKGDHSYLANFIAVGNCQNYDISQGPKENKQISGEDLSPSDIVKLAIKHKVPSISYTYTEPSIFIEYALETMKLAKKQRIKNTWVTNGYLTEKALKTIAHYLNAANVDLKFFDNDMYKKVCNAQLQPVLNTLKLIKKLKIWLEVTTLVIPGYTNINNQLEKIAEFIKKELGSETPWHVSRFYPCYKMSDVSPTSSELIHQAVKIGQKAGLKYVYAGNLPNDDGENTYCPKCQTLIIQRTGYDIKKSDKDGLCPKCGEKIDLIIYKS
ncbi:AmmeMemoRadiSam system radical SAM enzyme [Patescibacteria group bacterium]|nr:AmmeMemoRadiSam system radical SAM enzyme [Patescibacteria group bacterium]